MRGHSPTKGTLAERPANGNDTGPGYLLWPLSAPHEKSRIDSERLSSPLDFTDKTARILRITRGRFEIGDLLGPPAVEKHHVKFT